MRYDIITIFPNLIAAEINESIIKKAIEKGLIEVHIHDLRKWTRDVRKTVDDKIFGGNPGMLLQVEPIYRALKDLGVYPKRNNKTKVILTSASGKTWNQSKVVEYAEKLERIVIICGRYEGVDNRVAEHLIDEQISIGDYVLTGGELAANIILDSTARLIPGVLGNAQSLVDESHQPDNLNTLEYPQYSRPAEFKTDEGDTWSVPDILLSGNHAAIKNWQELQKKSET